MDLLIDIAQVLGGVAAFFAICMGIARAWRWVRERRTAVRSDESTTGGTPAPPSPVPTAGGGHLPPPNANFTGREEQLRNLRTSLEEGGTAALTQAITGLGGVGKTQLAIEYAHRHRDDYEVVWWVRSETPEQLADDFGALARRLGLCEEGETDHGVLREAALGWLESNGGWLLVFDNAPEANALKDYRPGGGRGHVIITSQNADWSGVAKPLPVEVWPPEESLEFLGKRIGRTDEAASELANELGDLPLALEQAAGYIEASGTSLEEYLKLYRERREELWGDQPPPHDYTHTVTTTWAMAMEGLREESAEAADLLNLIAFLAPDGIPRELLANAIEDPLAVNRAIAALQRYSLVSADDDSVSIHRLVQAVTRDRLSEEEEGKWAADAMGLLDDAFPFDQNDPATWAESGGLLPHALAAAGHAAEGEVELKTSGRLFNEAGMYLRLRAEFAAAKAALERALAIFEKAYGEDHPLVATVANNLGLVLQEMGDLDGARERFERALAIDEKAYGPDHPEVATDVNNLGSGLRDLGDLKGARERFERALAIDEKAYGPDHPTVALRVNNLGSVLRDLGDLKGAREHFERALAIDEKTFGPDHPKVAIRVNNLGSVLRAMGELKGARERFERALAIDEKAYGPEHPNVATAVNNLGGVLQDLGDLEGARQRYERALAIGEKTFGPGHPAVAIRANNLGSVLREMGDLKGARERFERALRIFRQFLGEDHPHTQTVRRNLESLDRG